MFRDASQLLREEPGGRCLWQVADFRWDGFRPVITLRELEGGALLEPELERIGWLVSEGRSCPGRREEGLPPCPEGADPGRFTRCRACDRLPVQECVFEPRCDGSSCPEAGCDQPHSVYVSFFGLEPKVGMTRSERVRARGVEQGADAIMPVAVCPNRLEARREEKRLSAAMGVRQAVSARDFARSLDRPPPQEAIREAAARMVRDNDLEGLGLIVLDGYPMPVLEKAPLPMPAPGWHQGEVLGWKGRFLVYRDRLGRPKMLDASDLVGRRMGRGPVRSGQTTLF